jgi:chromate transporter
MTTFEKTQMSSVVSLTQLGQTFLKIGALGFGGPFSLLAIMQTEIVERREWLSAEEFTESIGIGTLTPGPIFFAAAIFVSYRLRGLAGALVSGLCLLLPSFLLVILIAILYVQVEQSAWVMAITRGIAAGVVGLFLSVVLKTGRATAKNVRGALLVFSAFAAVIFLRLDPLLLIVIAGLVGARLFRPEPQTQVAEK